MKTRAIKFLIPAMAIVFAIVASAFTAIDQPMNEDNAFIPGYVPNTNPSEPCNEVQVQCKANGEYSCTIGNDTYFRFKDGTSCHTELKRDYL
ncbi:hypothetical protein J0X14_07655 [Muricauda sp. CAU 1633]|uniref:DUF6520 family protein n=1 Tax=Allomuricauda sp. CAU 1633 TaxID=2816036 RepID=UPI001A8F93E0|nr:DUF6520 family protein [Muricauda sp. CAU 1633]MBO0322166.1 hypothetical protein [Muricauda sp. CAU 1633]